MRLPTLLLILRRQFTSKWGRFLLASGGIMIGVWAISLTTSLSLGLTQTIITAINSQPAAREINVSQTETRQKSFFEITSAPRLVPISLADLNKLKQEIPAIQDVSPDVNMNLFVQLPKATNETKCVEQDLRLNNTDLSLLAASAAAAGTVIPDSLLNAASDSAASNPNLAKEREKLNAECLNITVGSASFSNFYANYKTNWVGQTTAPGQGEIVTCFRCGGSELDKKFDAKEPSDLIGKTIKVELQRSPELYPAGKIVDVTNFDRPQTAIKTSEIIDFKIVSVIDDRDSGSFGLSPYHIDYRYFKEAFEKVNPGVDINQYGTNNNVVFLKDYNDLDQSVKDIQDRGYLVFSLGQILVQSVVTFFNVLTIILAGFGFIALIASVFGIINVMTISVLERQKEIGILKSLGARNSDIFWIFLLESASLGFLGWLLGTLLSLGTGNLITTVSNVVINSNADWKRSLEAINITGFAPTSPWWLLLGTLLIALFFTIISGIFPSLKASSQNPVEVLRSE